MTPLRKHSGKRVRRRKVTLQEIQSLTGLLNFACTVVVPGRAFLRRLIDLTIGVRKPHFLIRLSKDVKEDLLVWQSFLSGFNGRSFFLADQWKNSNQLELYTDASGALGFGAVFGRHCCYGQWPHSWCYLNIAFLELYPTIDVEFNPKSRLNTFPFILFFTKRQQKYYFMWTKNRLIFEISMSNTQFHKTCFATILLNRDVYHYVKYGVLPPPPKIKRIDTPLAIEMRNLIDFDDITTPVSKTKPDLIPVSKKKQDPTPSVKTQNKIDKIIEKNIIDFTKDPYKSFTPKQSVNKIKKEVINALLTEINYPDVKDILGISLTQDLKDKISRLTTEAAIGLSWIIRALVLINKGKLPVYNTYKGITQLSKSQIREIIEYYFSSLAILLNPAQKY